MDGASGHKIEGPHFESIFTEPFKELVQSSQLRLRQKSNWCKMTLLLIILHIQYRVNSTFIVRLFSQLFLCRLFRLYYVSQKVNSFSTSWRAALLLHSKQLGFESDRWLSWRAYLRLESSFMLRSLSLSWTSRSSFSTGVSFWPPWTRNQDRRWRRPRPSDRPDTAWHRFGEEPAQTWTVMRIML